jgi:hypothetical protein
MGKKEKTGTKKSMAKGNARKGDSMDSPTGLITKATPLKFNKIIIETSLGKRYYSDLTFFQKVHCYPTTEEWKNVSIDSYGLDLIWSTRFEINITQVIDHSYKVENLKQVG